MSPPKSPVSAPRIVRAGGASDRSMVRSAGRGVDSEAGEPAGGGKVGVGEAAGVTVFGGCSPPPQPVIKARAMMTPKGNAIFAAGILSCLILRRSGRSNPQPFRPLGYHIRQLNTGRRLSARSEWVSLLDGGPAASGWSTLLRPRRRPGGQMRGSGVSSRHLRRRGRSRWLVAPKAWAWVWVWV